MTGHMDLGGPAPFDDYTVTVNGGHSHSFRSALLDAQATIEQQLKTMKEPRKEPDQ